ncbi:WecB/TagA/CpsF family glycosyltransferase [Acidimicrobiaceae bacterium]|nr:WecB/TagA/CpsF family glycosyltransferase [Acidimicrobiaceae bacterium]MDB4604282.1 WecB/TagA/CpsF family glycosyltransferase [Acidimicrobiia bacterium]
MNTVKILKTYISEISVSEVSSMLNNKNSLKVAICNTNTVIRSYRDETLGKIINSFDIKTPDGFPIAKSSSILYNNNQQRVDGYNVLLTTIREGLEKNTAHYFFGSEDYILKKVIQNLQKEFPLINIVGSFSPPVAEFKELTEEQYIQDIQNVNPDIVWVSLGFPKQEMFIELLQKKYRLQSNFVGIGAVFEWVAGTKIKAPEFIANLGLEWLLRLVQEPRRLFKRYFIDNFLFLYLITKQYISEK